MTTPRGTLRVPLLVLAIVALVAVVTIPALAASPSAGPVGSAPSASEKPGKGPKESREPEVSVTLSGVVSVATDAAGDATYSITSGGTTLKLDAGPSWFFGDKHPLAPFVGKTVTIVGDQREDEVDVEAVDGVRLRAEGKPPWAGGWKAVGSAHPGWTQEKADRWAAHQAAKQGGGKAGAAGCWPPGQCKDHGPDGSDEPAESPESNGG
ncbi:MAG: hypothetical protein QOF49_1780 [Chloroflexota bacterium]|jgi:hypothetical protein|nr:hypothetical protein [Chloroflexota bacterium]